MTVQRENMTGLEIVKLEGIFFESIGICWTAIYVCYIFLLTTQQEIA